jgi:hypothetical protein
MLSVGLRSADLFSFRVVPSGPFETRAVYAGQTGQTDIAEKPYPEAYLKP